MSNSLVCFSYENNKVSFYRKNDMLFVNATEMAKPFGRNKRPGNWLRTQPAIDYINELPWLIYAPRLIYSELRKE